jgi:hypothetical protein
MLRKNVRMERRRVLAYRDGAPPRGRIITIPSSAGAVSASPAMRQPEHELRRGKQHKGCAPTICIDAPSRQRLSVRNSRVGRDQTAMSNIAT